MQRKVDRETGDAALVERAADRFRHLLLPRAEAVQQERRRDRLDGLGKDERARNAAGEVHGYWGMGDGRWRRATGSGRVRNSGVILRERERSDARPREIGRAHV